MIFAKDGRLLVHIVYFRASDIEPQPNADAEIDETIKKVQRFFADEMERHGFGRKTFEVETDASGNTVVQHIVGKSPYAYYLKHRSDLHSEAWPQIDIPDRNRSMLAYMIEGRGSKEEGGFASGGGNNRRGYAFMSASESSSDVLSVWGWCVVAHELGHAFQLPHDFRFPYIMSYSKGSPPRLSQCSAEWLDVHPYFNVNQQVRVPIPSTLKMLPPSLSSFPYNIHLRFEYETPIPGLHQAKLIGDANVNLLNCKSLSGETSIIEFTTAALRPINKWVMLRVIDVHGHVEEYGFPIDITPLLPPPEVVSISDKNLATAVRDSLRLAPGETLTTHTMLNLKGLSAGPVSDLTGLEHAHTLDRLILWGHPALDDVSTLSGLTQLTHLACRELRDFGCIRLFRTETIKIPVP